MSWQEVFRRHPLPTTGGNPLEELFAISIALTIDPSDSQMLRASNQFLNQVEPERNIYFDRYHRPHMTLMQDLFYESDCYQIADMIAVFLEKEESLAGPWSGSYVPLHPSRERKIVSAKIGIQDKNWRLARAHQTIFQLTAPFSRANKGLSGSFFGTKMAQKNQQYVDAFRNQKADDRYLPHITLGFARPSEIEQMYQLIPCSSSFLCDRLMISQLGILGTVGGNIIAEWPLDHYPSS